ncbi:MAG: hypothetical protein Fur005_40790 [Roseiflexaceae bacterium]
MRLVITEPFQIRGNEYKPTMPVASATLPEAIKGQFASKSVQRYHYSRAITIVEDDYSYGFHLFF